TRFPSWVIMGIFGRCCSWMRLRAPSCVIGANVLLVSPATTAVPRTPAARGAAAVRLRNFRLETSGMIESPFRAPPRIFGVGRSFQPLFKAPVCCRLLPRRATGPSWRDLREPRYDSGSGTYATNRGSGRTTEPARWDATGSHL